MNLLFVFLKDLPLSMRVQVNTMMPRGTLGSVWALLNEQATIGDFDKKSIIDKTGVSTSHLDKITSELLTKCYQILFGNDAVALLEFLSSQVPLIKLFYSEMYRQLNLFSKVADNGKQIELIQQCFRMINNNMPMAYRDPKAIDKLSSQYISLFKGKQKKQAEFYVGCKQLLQRIEVLFAASTIKEKADEIENEFVTLGLPKPDYDSNTVFEYYWIKSFFYHAKEQFNTGFEIACEGLTALSKYDEEDNRVNSLRMELKKNEFRYYLSQFDAAYENYHRLIKSPIMDLVSDRPYHLNKYLQLCLITDHLEDAGIIVQQRLDRMGGRVDQLIIIRDVISYIKYYLLSGNYDQAFSLLKIGFEKNPKGKYFQYEVELRNLQTAYFYLSSQLDVAMDMCRTHIKFLRNHGYTSSNSDYPHFYVIINALIEKGTKEPLSVRHQKMFDRYQLGSFAIYGRLLQKIRKHKSSRY